MEIRPARRSWNRGDPWNQREEAGRQEKVQRFKAGVLQAGAKDCHWRGLSGGAGIRGASCKTLPEPHPSVPPAHWMVHLSRSRAWPSRRTLALMYLRSLLTLGRRAKGETMP